MDVEERKLLERAVELGEENSKMLRAIRRGNRVAMAFRFTYWIVIIGLSIGAFYFIQPYFDAVVGGATGAKNSLDSFNQLLQQYR